MNLAVTETLAGRQVVTRGPNYYHAAIGLQFPNLSEQSDTNLKWSKREMQGVLLELPKQEEDGQHVLCCVTRLLLTTVRELLLLPFCILDAEQDLRNLAVGNSCVPSRQVGLHEVEDDVALLRGDRLA